MRRFSVLAAVLAVAAAFLVAPTGHAGVPAPAGRSDLRAFQGLATWVDGYDYARELTTAPTVGIEAIPRMKARGVRTIWLQAAKESPRTPYPLLSKDRLGKLLQVAHDHGIRVVAWYLPTFADPARDWRHVAAMLTFTHNGHRFDGYGLDIEDNKVPVQTRNARLVALSKLMRSKTSAPMAAIVMPPVITEVINPRWWGGGFPWTGLKPSYDIWVPMGYYTAYARWPYWRDAYRSTTEDIRRIRARVGPVPIHYAGGLAGRSNITDYKRFIAAARDQGAIGISAYDYATTPSWAWYYLLGGARQVFPDPG